MEGNYAKIKGLLMMHRKMMLCSASSKIKNHSFPKQYRSVALALHIIKVFERTVKAPSLTH